MEGVAVVSKHIYIYPLNDISRHPSGGCDPMIGTASVLIYMLFDGHQYLKKIFTFFPRDFFLSNPRSMSP